MTSRKDAVETEQMLQRLQSVGISREDAESLRRISMTLHRWHELECGDGNEYGSWAITRGHFDTRECKFADGNGERPKPKFAHDDDGAPYLEHHHYRHGRGADSVSYTRLADRETGARKRLAAILSRYPTLTAYVQGDPRGCALYILRPGDVPKGEKAESYYSRGIAVYK